MEFYVINLITNRIIEYFFYIFLEALYARSPNSTLRSWDNHQLKRKRK
jgi:hypothetical protein